MQGADIIDVIVKFKDIERLVLFSSIPIKLDNGKIVGVQVIGRFANLPSHMEIILKHSQPNALAITELPMTVELNNREQMIVYLLIAGFTQEEIGKYLGYSRGHIAKIIATAICPKFGLKGSSTKRLIKLAVYHSVLNNKIPEDIAERLASFSLSM
ncbi:MAG: sigma factor-like helix-turn-helix DNA-binding protein [Neisseriaceae bacterium]